MSRSVLSWTQFPREEAVDVPVEHLDDAYFVEHDVRGRDVEQGYQRRLAENAEMDAKGEDYDRHPTDEPQNMDALTESVRNHGVRQPLVVAFGEVPDPVIVDGNHRYLAAKRAGLSSVPVRRASY